VGAEKYGCQHRPHGKRLIRTITPFRFVQRRMAYRLIQQLQKPLATIFAHI
jgi:hypothetical protein